MKKFWQITCNICAYSLVCPPVGVLLIPLLIVAKGQAEKMERPNNGIPQSGKNILRKD